MWISKHFMNDQAKAVFALRVSGTKEVDSQRREKTIKYCHAFNYLLATYAAHTVIAETKADIKNFKRLERMLAVRYSEVLWETALLCWPVFDESRKKEVLTERLHKSIRVQWEYTGVRKRMRLSRTWNDMRHPCRAYIKELRVAALTAIFTVTQRDHTNNS